jgi:hypothetical protein
MGKGRYTKAKRSKIDKISQGY